MGWYGIDRAIWELFRNYKIAYLQLTGKTASSVETLLKDSAGNKLLCRGTTVPTGAGYAKGCLFIDTDVATGYQGMYENIGTTAAASFKRRDEYALNMTGTMNKAINFDGITASAPGNYGTVLDCTWLSIAGGSGFGAKLMFSNSAATVLYGFGLRCRTKYAGGIAVGLNVSASTAVANSGGVQAIQGYCQIDPTFTVAAGGTNACTALYGKTLNKATNAAVCSALWVDEGSTVKATTHYLVDLTLNGGAIALDSIFHVYAGTQTAALLFSLEGSCGVSAGSTKSTPSGVDKWLDIKIDGTAYYVPCYTSKTA